MEYKNLPLKELENFHDGQLLLVDKPLTWTSFDVVKKIRGIINEKKVGHAGTLDPFATGVLILGTGSDTKKLSNIASSNKTYIADLTLGIETDTLDCDGNIVSKYKTPELSQQLVKDVLSKLPLTYNLVAVPL